MENYQMNRPGCRPYNRTCGMMNTPVMARRDAAAEKSCPYQPKNRNCSCVMPGSSSAEREMYEHIQHLPDAMAYVPCQEFTTTYDLGYALSVGTIFPQLCKPFCVKRGGCK